MVEVYTHPQITELHKLQKYWRPNSSPGDSKSCKWRWFRRTKKQQSGCGGDLTLSNYRITQVLHNFQEPLKSTDANRVLVITVWDDELQSRRWTSCKTRFETFRTAGSHTEGGHRALVLEQIQFAGRESDETHRLYIRYRQLQWPTGLFRSHLVLWHQIQVTPFFLMKT